VVSGNNHEWQLSHCNGDWLSDSKLQLLVEWWQLHLHCIQLKPRHTRKHPKSQVDNAPEDLKGNKGTNARTKNQSSYLLNIYIYVCPLSIIVFSSTNITSVEAPKPKNLQTTTKGISWWKRPNSVYGGSAHTLQQWWCIYERPSLQSNAVWKN